MKKYILLSLLIAFLIFSAWTPNNNNETSDFIHQNITLFHQKSISFQYSIENKKNIAEILEKYKTLQYSFRKIQFLLEYISAETVKREINGPPLPSLEQNIPVINVLEPKGLQVIDELLYEENIDTAQLRIKAKELSDNIAKSKYIFMNSPLSEADTKRAIYQDIIRIYTLQITGFDTPGSSLGLDNAVYNFEGIIELVTDLYPQSKLQKPCEEAKNYLLKHKDFATFDRVYFYKKHIQPILGIITAWETNDLPIKFRNQNEKYSLNYNSKEIFSLDFFNLANFTNLPEPTTQNPEIIALGKKLFYDPILSSANNLSCGSCHKPELAFTDGRERSMTNLEGLVGKRNTPTLLNSVLSKGFFYDLREEEPSRQIAHVVKDKNEFNSDFIDIMERLEKNESYNSQFLAVFPVEKISKYSITTALTAYVATLCDFDSPFDKYMRNEISYIEPNVIKGFNLFAGKAACATCHFIPTFNGLTPPLFKDSESEVLGIPSKWGNAELSLDTDWGRIASGKPQDEAEHLRFSFKTTSVRNVKHTAPYMHNGSFENLDDVLDFYNKGGGLGLGFDLKYQTLSDTPLDLTKEEKQDIIAFLNALSTDKKY